MNGFLDGIVLLRKNGAAMGIVQAYAPAESKEETNPMTSGNDIAHLHDHLLLLGLLGTENPIAVLTTYKEWRFFSWDQGEVVVPAGTLHQGILRATSILTDISQILSVDERALAKSSVEEDKEKTTPTEMESYLVMTRSRGIGFDQSFAQEDDSSNHKRMKTKM